MKFHTLVVSFLSGALLLVSPANAKELKDASFGFQLELPDHFNQLPADPSDPDTIHKLVDRDPTPENPATVIQIQRLRGTIPPGARMKESEIPVTEGITTTLQDFTWKGLELDVVRQTLTLPNGLELIVFGIQYPLSGEAVHLQVGGPASKEQEISSLFQQLAGQFENTKPLHSAAKFEVRKLSTEERAGKLAGGIIRLSIVALVIIFLLGMARRAFSKKKSAAQQVG